jgi:hypothetical protein
MSAAGASVQVMHYDQCEPHTHQFRVACSEHRVEDLQGGRVVNRCVARTHPPLHSTEFGHLTQRAHFTQQRNGARTVVGRQCCSHSRCVTFKAMCCPATTAATSATHTTTSCSCISTACRRTPTSTTTAAACSFVLDSAVVTAGVSWSLAAP